MIALAPDLPPLRKMSLKAGRNDSVASVAKRYRVSASQVAQWNGVARSARFKAGQNVVVYVAVKGKKNTQITRTAKTGKAVAKPTSSTARKIAAKTKGKVRIARN